LNFIAWQDRKPLLSALRSANRAEAAAMARQLLAEFVVRWRQKFSAID
jgi:transposase-like protein